MMVDVEDEVRHEASRADGDGGAKFKRRNLLTN
jgi:hypothetical protein